MNKLLVSDIIEIESGNYLLDCKSKKIDLIIKGEVIIYLIDQNINKLNIKLEDDSVLKIYKYDQNIRDDLEVNIEENNNSKIFYNATYISNFNTLLKINNYLKGNDNTSNINVRNVSNKDESKLIINVYVKEKTTNNIALEDLKGINNGGIIHIEPNIVVDSNEVIANHLTTIGGIDENSLNYLRSKGISQENAQKILLKGFIFSNMDNYIKENFGGDKIA